jgi:branched-chain amino acid aminotransferase
MPVPPTPKPLCDTIWFDGDFVGWDDAKVHVLSHVLHYGSSVFEGIRCYKTPDGPAVFRLREHIQRLAYSAKVARIPMAYRTEELVDVCVESVRRNALEECYIRPLIFRGAGAMGLFPKDCPTHTMIASWEWGAYLSDEGLKNGIDVMVSTWRKMPPNSMPALAKIGGAYSFATMCKMEAIEHGFAEAILLDVDGRVAEGTGENLFAVIDDVLVTPPISNSVLPGITRKSLLQLARDRGIPVSVEPLSRAALYLAEEIFLTGTAAEVTPVKTVDRLPVGNGKPGPITQQLQADFFEVIRGKVPDRHGWLTVVEPAATGA